MKIAYVYEYNAANPHIQSSRPYSILRELERRTDIAKAFPISNISRLVLAPIKIVRELGGRTYHLEREALALREYAHRAERQLAKINPDVVFSPSQLTQTYLQTDAKKIYCNDAPFSGIEDYYTSASNLEPSYRRLAYRQERLSHKNADKIVYPSEWARDLAVQNHEANLAKCQVQPFGANLPYEPLWNEVDEAIKVRIHRSDISVLLISSDWVRKGGQFAIDVVKGIRQLGHDATLTVMGDAPATEDVRRLGRIDKWQPTGAADFRRALMEADFLIQPSSAEAYGMALWEGAAHGLPMVGRKTGGISSIIETDRTGLLFDGDWTAKNIADWMIKAKEPRRYRELASAAYSEYNLRGNWRVFVNSVFGEYGLEMR